MAKEDDIDNKLKKMTAAFDKKLADTVSEMAKGFTEIIETSEKRDAAERATLALQAKEADRERQFAGALGHFMAALSEPNALGDPTDDADGTRSAIKLIGEQATCLTVEYFRILDARK